MTPSSFRSWYRHYRLSLVLLASAFIVLIGILFAYQKISGPQSLKIIVIMKSIDPGFEFWSVVSDGIEEASKEFETDVSVRGPWSESNVDEQVNIGLSAVEERPDALILAAIDYAKLAPVAERARKLGVPVFILDSGVDSNAPKSIIATDNVKAGQEVGSYMSSLLNHKGKVAIISYVRNASSLLARDQGVREVLKTNPNMEVLDTIYAEGIADNVDDLTEQLLREHPDLQGIVGLNEPTSVGVGYTLRKLGKQGSIKLVGFDNSIAEIKLVEEGIMQGTVIQRPFQMGYISVKTAIDQLRGKEIEREIDTDSYSLRKRICTRKKIRSCYSHSDNHLNYGCPAGQLCCF